MLGYMRSYTRSTLTFVFVLFPLLCRLTSPSDQCVKSSDCNKNGLCMRGICICNSGWWGNLCQFCRLRLSVDNGEINDGHGAYATSSKCSWLIESPRPNSTIHLDLKMFATECNWDHLYIYDGNSVKSPLIAVLSGIIKDPKRGNFEQSLMLRANSGSALLYFYSDKLYNEKGFKIKYSISTDCSAKCSFHGSCGKNEQCICDSGWTGAHCDIQTCIADCVNGFCSNDTRLCVCYPGFYGASCNVSGEGSFWTQYSSKGAGLIQERASHAAAVIGDYMWVFGGFSLNPGPFENLVRYHIPSDSWEVVRPFVNSTAVPSQRYGHSMIAYNGSLYLFGGRIGQLATDELWAFDTRTLVWSLPPRKGTPLPVAGHTATLVGSTMIVLFGYGQRRNYTDKVQEYDLETGTWSIHDVPKDIIHPTFAHSSAYDPATGIIYIHGGFFDNEPSTSLASYDPTTRTWRALANSSVPRFLHTAVFVDGMMLVFGGNSHNGTTRMPSNLSCFSMDFLAYDTVCDEWKKLSLPESLKSSGRYGHSAVAFNRTMFVFGGFQGVLLKDVLSFTSGPCALMRDKSSCEMSSNVSGCMWNERTSTCLGPERCATPLTKEREKCRKLGQSCTRCTSSVHGCSWCEGEKQCVSGNCRNGAPKIDSLAKCSRNAKSSSCQGTDCENKGCYNLSSCEDCTKESLCMWCESEKQCVAKNSYPVSFPYGQCRGWVEELQCSAERCSGMKTCDECHTLPGCGWCDDGSGTGLGECMEGGNDGPFNNSDADAVTSQCPSDLWFFVECPDCQCNGHSTCINRNICEKCQGQTSGPRCEVCSPGHHGDPKNGGTCQACECNGHANSCDSVTGHCNCLARYVTGKNCERCEKDQNNDVIVGNATNGGHCYNKLSRNLRYTFIVSNKTSISFLYIPTEDDDDVYIEVEIERGQPALLNLSYSTVSSPSYALESRHQIGSFRKNIPHDTFNFGGSDEFSFEVHVFDIKGTVKLQITFVQRPEFGLLRFFVTFFACFFSLLFIVALAWKIKVRYSSYVMARHRVEEMKQMASRPFAKVCLALTNPHLEAPNRQTLPSAIVVQPTENHTAAVGVFMMRLPGDRDGYTPIGQTGICCATALGTRGKRGLRPPPPPYTNRGTMVKRSNLVTSCCA
ncbi:attractin-like protein 1 isoform X2 [Acropora millepora]|uniref:attractin-like protein 1 isoform X2 n=1 Tax=Acropora millepora TaxID=45264 RepID=UPI001CF36D85|nr:attractin-like protein 1 isoform X2 [Acropora millepora]